MIKEMVKEKYIINMKNGEFFNDKYHGKGKKYDNFGKLEYEGDFLNDKKMEKEKNIIVKVN